MKERMKLRIEKSKVRSINRTSFGFTLIELSIVLIIISLIVAGITGGKALIKQAELQSVSTDLMKLRTSINAFILSYNAYPGDFSEAGQYWTIASCPNAPIAGSNGCNGDDDGAIGCGLAGVSTRECIRAWQHLSLAEILPGDYTGCFDPACTVDGDVIGGTNVPVSEVETGVFQYMTIDASIPTQVIYDRGGILISFGGENGSNNSRPILTTVETKAIDIKLDDGVPHGGFVNAIDGGGVTDCVDVNGNNPSPPAQYTLDSTGLQCQLKIWLE